MGGKQRSASRGTDDPFYRLMKVSGGAVLKLIGIKSPEEYTSRAIVLKEKKLYPDIMAVPKKKKNRDRVFIEFQGYKDPMIRYRAAAQIAASCIQEKYTGPVCGAIIYTDRIFQQAALPFEIRSVSSSFRLEGRFTEIVLPDYTCEQLTAVDPRLVILAPFTVPKNTGKDRLSLKCRQWREKVSESYEGKDEGTAVQILGLFILNRFRNLSLKEVIRMMNFDLSKTRAGKELIGIGMEKGMERGIEKGGVLKARELLIFAFEQKWGPVPGHIDEAVRKISAGDTLRELFGTLLQSRTQHEFELFLKNAEISGNA